MFPVELRNAVHVEIAVAGCFHNDDAKSNCVSDRDEYRVIHFNGEVVAILNFEQENIPFRYVTRRQSGVDGIRDEPFGSIAGPVMRGDANLSGVWSDADDSPVVVSSRHDSENSCSMRLVAGIAVLSHPWQREYPREILVAEKPTLLEIHERHRFSRSVAQSPCPPRIDSSGCRIELELLIRKRVVRGIDSRFEATELPVGALDASGSGEPFDKRQQVIDLTGVESPVRSQGRQVTRPALARDVFELQDSAVFDAGYERLDRAVRVVVEHA